MGRSFASLLHKNRSKVAHLSVVESAKTPNGRIFVIGKIDEGCAEFLGHEVPKSQMEQFKGHVKETLVLHNQDDKVRACVGIGDEKTERMEENARTLRFMRYKSWRS